MILLIITIIAVLIFRNVNARQTSNIVRNVTGGGQFEPTPCKDFDYLLNDIQDAFIVDFKFDKVSPCPEVMSELFGGNGPYAIYRNKNGGDTVLKYIESFAAAGELPYSAENHIIDMRKLTSPKIDDMQLLAKDRDSGITYNPHYAQSSFLEIRHASMIFNTFFMLPEDAVHEPVGAKRNTS